MVGDGERLLQLMRHKQAGQTHRIVQLANQPCRRAKRDRVQPRERLVVHDQFGIQGDGARQGNTPRHAARYLTRHQVARATQANRIELHQYDVANQAGRQVGVFAQGKRHVVEHAEVGEQCSELEQHAHAPACRVQSRLVQGADVCNALRTIQEQFARLRTDLATDQTKDGGFSAARCTHQGRHLAARYRQ